jgi:hypothetical protein
MELPPHLGGVQDLVRREQKAFDHQAMWHEQLTDVYEYFLPQRNLFEVEDKGQKKMDRIFDSTALTAIQQGASKLQENIAPIWSRWATFQPSNEVIRMVESGDYGVTEQDIRENLDEQAETVFDYINRSNFATQLNPCRSVSTLFHKRGSRSKRDHTEPLKPIGDDSRSRLDYSKGCGEGLNRQPTFDRSSKTHPTRRLRSQKA